jgi:hypothetical protein
MIVLSIPTEYINNVLRTIKGFFMSDNEQKQFYKLFAFAILLKFNRENSMVYNDESFRKLASDNNINGRTFKKYFNLCKKEGIIVGQGEHYNVIAYHKIINVWQSKFDNSQEYNKECDLFSHLQIFNQTTYKKKTFKNIYNQILDSIIIKNFKQQQYRINEVKQWIGIYNKSFDGNKNLNKYEQKQTKLLMQRAASFGMSVDAFIKRLNECDIYIKTGKFHAAKKVNMSASTGTRILKRLQTEEKVYREIVVLPTNIKVNHAGFDYLKAQNKEQTIIISEGEFMVAKGSRIEMNTFYMDNCYSIESPNYYKKTSLCVNPIKYNNAV